MSGVSKMSNLRTEIAGAGSAPIPHGTVVKDEQVDKTSLRVHLLRDFGVDLPIEGGFGEKDAPVVITEPDLQQAVDVQMKVLECHGKKRRVAWRVLDQQVMSLSSRVVRTSLETIEVTATEVVTQEEGLYFVFDALPMRSSTIDLPPPRGFEDARSGLRLPHQLGWLHYKRMIDNEAEAPGLGCTADYGVPGIDASVYVYNQGRRDIPDDVKSDMVIGEFLSAVRGALMVRKDKGAKVVNQGFVGGGVGPSTFALAMLELHKPMMSAVMMTSWNGHFVKGRVTWNASEKQLHNIAIESIRAIVEAVHPGPALQERAAPGLSVN